MAVLLNVSRAEAAQATPAWKAVSRRRLWFQRLTTLGLMGTMTLVTFCFLVLDHYPYAVSLPFICCYFLLGYLGMSYFVGMWMGFYASRLPPEKDAFNPLNHCVDLPVRRRIAVLMPVYHEEACRVAGALAAMAESLIGMRQKAGWAEEGFIPFDFFLLSDSRDPDCIVREEATIFWLRERFSGRAADGEAEGCRVSFYYRNRVTNRDAKLGNIADFLRKWGREYDYMIMLDADSMMPGATLWAMARAMEGNSRIGIIQANLKMALRRTLYARIARFISSFTLTLGFYSMYFIFMGDAYYYGHNAIVRVAPFMENCALPTLKKRGPFSGGKPLSHDYIEAALLGSAGYEIWSLPMLDAFEELPTNQIDDIIRETRWLYGSLTYLRVVFVSRIKGGYRWRLFTSAINYFSPVLGWIYLILSLFGLRFIFMNPLRSVFLMKKFQALFIFALGFLAFTLVARFIVPALYYARRREVRLYGGWIKMSWSYLLYVVFNMLIGPLFMAQMARAILFWLRGRRISWGAQSREDRRLDWEEALRDFWWVSAIGLAFGWAVLEFTFSHDTLGVQRIIGIPKWGLLFWYVPMVAGLVLAPAVVKFTSGEIPLLEKMRWMVSPDEISPPPIIVATRRQARHCRNFLRSRVRNAGTGGDPAVGRKGSGVSDFEVFLRSPWFTVRHLTTHPPRPVKAERWAGLAQTDPKALSPVERRRVFHTPELWWALHRAALARAKKQD